MRIGLDPSRIKYCVPPVKHSSVDSSLSLKMTANKFSIPMFFYLDT